MPRTKTPRRRGGRVNPVPTRQSIPPRPTPRERASDPTPPRYTNQENRSRQPSVHPPRRELMPTHQNRTRLPQTPPNSSPAASPGSEEANHLDNESDEERPAERRTQNHTDSSPLLETDQDNPEDEDDNRPNIQEKFNQILDAFEESGGNLDRYFPLSLYLLHTLQTLYLRLAQDPRLSEFKKAAQGAARKINLFLGVEQACKAYHDISTEDFQVEDGADLAPNIVCEARVF